MEVALPGRPRGFDPIGALQAAVDIYNHGARAFEVGQNIGSAIRASMPVATSGEPAPIEAPPPAARDPTAPSNRKRGRVEETVDVDASGQRGLPEGGGGGIPGTGNQVLVTLPPIVGKPDDHIQTITRRFKTRNVFHWPVNETQLWPPEMKSDETGLNFVCSQGWGMIPWKSSAMYIPRDQAMLLRATTGGYRFVEAGFKLSNFTTSTGNVTGSAGVNQQYGGVGFYSMCIEGRNIGPYFCSKHDSESTPINHGDVYEYFTKPNRNPNSVRFPFEMTSIASEYEREKNGHYGVVIPRLEDYANYNVGCPSNIVFSAKMPPKQWRSGRLIRYRTPAKLYKAGSNIPYQCQPATWPVRDTDIPYYLDSPYSLDPTNIGNPTRYSRTSSSKDGLWENIYPVNGQPLTKYVYDNMVHVGQTMPGGDNTNGQGTPSSINDLFAFKITVPPTLDGSSPNIMVSFTLETECIVEYIDPMSISDCERFLAYTGENDQAIPTILGGYAQTSNRMNRCLAAVYDESDWIPDYSLTVPYAHRFPIMDVSDTKAHAVNYQDGCDSMGANFLYQPGYFPEGGL